MNPYKMRHNSIDCTTKTHVKGDNSNTSFKSLVRCPGKAVNGKYN